MRWTIGFVICTLVGLILASRTIVLSDYVDAPAPTWWQAIRAGLVVCYLWGLATVLVFAIARRLPFERGKRFHAISAHACALMALSWIHSVVYPVLSPEDGATATALAGWAGRFGVPSAATIRANAFVYALILGVRKTLRVYRKYQAHELQTTRLLAQLAQAKLSTLRMQLQPHFLFNTLNAISALTRSDPGTAERMIARLSDLLRTTLETFDVDEVTMSDEMDFVRSYMEIEQARFGERLTFEERVAPFALDALLPPLILQPLVENAVRHGLAETSGRCVISITAVTADGTLRIEICDTGPGLRLDQDSTKAGGVGLTNTRARLEHLYGQKYRLELENGRPHGTVVRLVIPLPPETPSPSVVKGG